MVIDFEKAYEIEEFLKHLDIYDNKYGKRALADNLSYRELTGIIYEDKFPKTELNALDAFFRETIKQTIITYCSLLKNEDKTIKFKKDDKLVKKIMRTDLNWVYINKESKVLKEVEKHVSKYGNERLAKKLGHVLGKKIYKQDNINLIKRLVNQEFPSYTSDFFNVKNFSNTLDKLVFRIKKQIKDERKR